MKHVTSDVTENLDAVISNSSLVLAPCSVLTFTPQSEAWNLHYKGHPVNVIEVSNECIFWDSSDVHKHPMWAEIAAAGDSRVAIFLYWCERVKYTGLLCIGSKCHGSPTDACTNAATRFYYFS